MENVVEKIKPLGNSDIPLLASIDFQIPIRYFLKKPKNTENLACKTNPTK